ncbi:hypothetical protein BGZ94_010242 [Podila epigama]|nr:hypothetical protein BGZ94_010242 [Podila epigama]
MVLLSSRVDKKLPQVVLTAEEQKQYDYLWSQADPEEQGFLNGEDGAAFFKKSGLPLQTLGNVWHYADSSNKGVLGRSGFNVAMRLIAHAQNGKTPSEELVTQGS